MSKDKPHLQKGDSWSAIVDDWSSETKTLYTNDPFTFAVHKDDWDALDLQLGATICFKKMAIDGSLVFLASGKDCAEAARCRLIA